MSIQDLPDELLLHIFKPFADIHECNDPSGRTDTLSRKVKSNLKTLASLSKVCIKWHRIVEPILYSTFRKPATTTTAGFVFRPMQSDHPSGNLARLWTPGPNDYYLTISRPGSVPSQNDHTRVALPNQTLRLFMRTILEQPHLAVSIKRLVLGSWLESVNLRHEPRQYMIEPSQPDRSLQQTYFRVLQRLIALRCSPRSTAISLWREFVSQVLEGYEGSELILLLQSTPNLVTLHLAQIPVIEEWMGIGENGLARHVSTICLGSTDGMLDVRLFRLRTLMILPSLRSLTFINCSVHGYLFCPRPKLTHLSFQRCHISHGAFGFLMEYMHNLESFEWISRFDQHRDLDQSWIVQHDTLTNKILAFVRRQKPTLQRLRILGCGFGDRTTAQESFKSLDLLEKLTIESRLLDEERLCLSDQLPQSLEYLMVSQCCEQMMAKLVAVVGARALPNLKEIEFSDIPLEVLPDPYRMPYEFAAIELEEICAAEGIVLTSTMKQRWTSVKETAL